MVWWLWKWFDDFGQLNNNCGKITAKPVLPSAPVNTKKLRILVPHPFAHYVYYIFFKFYLNSNSNLWVIIIILKLQYIF